MFRNIYYLPEHMGNHVKNKKGEIYMTNYTCVHLRTGEDDFASLSCEQAAYYSKLFQNPEIFLQSGTQLTILQIEQ